jgi:glycosyltransferase involved in cell wall biosynthesis
MYTQDLPGVAKAKATLLTNGIPEVHFLGMRVHPPLGKMFPAILKLHRFLQDKEYDIVETSMLSPAVLASWATRGTRARHVVGVHQVFRRDRENSKQHKFWRFSVRSNPHVRYYAISDYVANHWIKYSDTRPRYIRRIYNAISDDYFVASSNRDRDGVRKELGIADDGRLALYVGRLAAYKGINTLLCALGPVLKQQNLFLLYAGLPDLSVKGTQQMLKEIQKQITEKEWGGRVRFLGYRKDISRLMASSDILIHPTRMEGFGLTLTEAMATGLPVVTSNVEGIPEVLAGTDSIMVPPDEPETLRSAVLRTLNRTAEEAHMAHEKGLRRAQSFRSDRRTNAMASLFRDVLSGRF